jgi:hypothetical protein
MSGTPSSSASALDRLYAMLQGSLRERTFDCLCTCRETADVRHPRSRTTRGAETASKRAVAWCRSVAWVARPRDIFGIAVVGSVFFYALAVGPPLLAPPSYAASDQATRVVDCSGCSALSYLRPLSMFQECPLGKTSSHR